jgi:hypothetical protein
VNLLRRILSSDFVRRDLRIAAVPWALARVLIIGSLWMSRFLADKLPDVARTRAPNAGLFIYDGDWYRAIADHGYGARQSLRFFPLYPLLGRWLGAVFADHVGAALVVIAWAAALVFGALLVRLVLRETNDEDLAARAAWYGAIFPLAISFVLAYAEPLMMVAVVGAFLALRSRRWLIAAPLGLVAGLTRPVGVLLLVPAAIEAWRDWRGAKRGELAARAAAVAAPAVGLGVYMAWVEAEYGNAFEPFDVQTGKAFRGPTIDPFTHIVNGFDDLFDGDRFGAGIHLLWIAVFIGLLVVLARRLPASYVAYAGASLLLGLTATNISSFERYAYSTIPFIIAVAIVTARGEIHRVVMAVAAGSMVAYSMLAFYEAYVP